MTMDVIVQGYA